MTILTTLVFLGISVSVAAHPCPAPPDGHKHCLTGGGGGGGGNEPPAAYEAALTMGGFRFDPVAVTLNKRGNIFNGMTSQQISVTPLLPQPYEQVECL